MLTIHSEQLAALDAEYRPRRRTHILRCIRARRTRNADGIDDAEALRRIDDAIADGKEVGITQDEDVVRLASLAFLPDAVRADSSIVWIITRTLCRQDWEPARRLDLIERLVV